MLGAGAEAVEPGAAVLGARGGERGAGELLGIKAESGLLRRVAALGQRPGHRLGSEMVAEAGHVVGIGHAVPIAPHSGPAKGKRKGRRGGPRRPSRFTLPDQPNRMSVIRIWSP